MEAFECRLRGEGVRKIGIFIFALLALALAYLIFGHFVQKEQNTQNEIDPNSLHWNSVSCETEEKDCSRNYFKEPGQQLFSETPLSKESVSNPNQVRETSDEIREKYGVLISFGGANENYYLARALFDEDNFSLGLKHLKVSANIGLPEARYHLASLYESEDSQVQKDDLKAYIWYQATDEVFRRGNEKVRYQNAEEKALQLRALLTQTQLNDAGQELIELSELSNRLYREYSAKLNKHLEEQSHGTSK